MSVLTALVLAETIREPSGRPIAEVDRITAGSCAEAIAMGQRQLGWPESHAPRWVKGNWEAALDGGPNGFAVCDDGALIIVHWRALPGRAERKQVGASLGHLPIVPGSDNTEIFAQATQWEDPLGNGGLWTGGAGIEVETTQGSHGPPVAITLGLGPQAAHPPGWIGWHTELLVGPGRWFTPMFRASLQTGIGVDGIRQTVPWAAQIPLQAEIGLQPAPTLRLDLYGRAVWNLSGSPLRHQEPVDEFTVGTELKIGPPRASGGRLLHVGVAVGDCLGQQRLMLEVGVGTTGR